MFALLTIMAVLTALATVFAIIIHEMAEARRQECRDDMSVDHFGLGYHPANHRHVPVAQPRIVATPLPRRQVINPRAHRRHSNPILH